MVIRGAPVGEDVFNPGHRRTLTDLRQERVHSHARAFHIGFHRAIGLIADPTGELEFLSYGLSKKTKSNALNAALDDEVESGGGGRCGHYLIIAIFPDVSLPCGSMIR